MEKKLYAILGGGGGGGGGADFLPAAASRRLLLAFAIWVRKQNSHSFSFSLLPNRTAEGSPRPSQLETYRALGGVRACVCVWFFASALSCFVSFFFCWLIGFRLCIPSPENKHTEHSHTHTHTHTHTHICPLFLNHFSPLPPFLAPFALASSAPQVIN